MANKYSLSVGKCIHITTFTPPFTPADLAQKIIRSLPIIHDDVAALKSVVCVDSYLGHDTIMFEGNCAGEFGRFRIVLIN